MNFHHIIYNRDFLRLLFFYCEYRDVTQQEIRRPVGDIRGPDKNSGGEEQRGLSQDRHV